MKATIGVLWHNSEHMLPDLIRSLPAGLAGVPDWKLIVADSASTDRTVEVVGSLAPDATMSSWARISGSPPASTRSPPPCRHTVAVLILSPTARLNPAL